MEPEIDQNYKFTQEEIVSMIKVQRPENMHGDYAGLVGTISELDLAAQVRATKFVEAVFSNPYNESDRSGFRSFEFIGNKLKLLESVDAYCYQSNNPGLNNSLAVISANLLISGLVQTLYVEGWENGKPVLRKVEEKVEENDKSDDPNNTDNADNYNYSQVSGINSGMETIGLINDLPLAAAANMEIAYWVKLANVIKPFASASGNRISINEAIKGQIIAQVPEFDFVAAGIEFLLKEKATHKEEGEVGGKET